MAQRVFTTLVDDLDNESEASETVTFGLDGKEYEIDLTEENAAALREAVAPFVGAARRVGSGRRARKGAATGPGRGGSSSGPGGGTAPDRAAIRAWARENGFEVGDRGRIPQEVQDRYAAAVG